MVSVCVLIGPFVLLNSSHPKKNVFLEGKQDMCWLSWTWANLCLSRAEMIPSWPTRLGKDCRIAAEVWISKSLCANLVLAFTESTENQGNAAERDTDVGWLVDRLIHWYLTVNFKVWTQDQKHLLLWMEYCRGHLRDRCRTFVSWKICSS